MWLRSLFLSMRREKLPRRQSRPTELKDLSVSQVQGTKLLYVGYEFEIPWNDLDPSQTRSVPKDHPEMVALVFRSGLHLIVSASPPRMLPNESAREWKLSPQKLESFFGRGTSQSDYSFLENLYEFTPKRCTAGDSARVCTTANRCCSC